MEKIIEAFKCLIQKSEEIYTLAMFDKKKTWDEIDTFICQLEKYVELKKENNIVNNISYDVEIDRLKSAIQVKDYIAVIDCIKFEIQQKFNKEF